MLLLAGIAWVSSRTDPLSPEGQIEKAITEMVEGAEKKSVSPFKEHLSEDIRDDSGRGKKDMLNILRGIYLRHQKIHLQILSLDFAGSTNPHIMNVQLELLMSETNLPTDRGRFSLTFRDENGTWRLTEAVWNDGYGYE